MDSNIFQASFAAFLYSNGIVPTVVYEDLGEAGKKLAAAGKKRALLMGASKELAKEDMNITPVIVSNHISYLDGLVLASTFHVPKVVAKSGSRDVPVMGKLMEEMEVVFVDRGSGDSKKATLDAIKEHCVQWKTGSRPLLIFPEGTTTNGEEIIDFKRGAFISGLPVRPTIMIYTGRYDPATTNFHEAEGKELVEHSDQEWVAQFMGHFIHSMHVRVLPPYIPSEEEANDPDLYAKRCHEYMAKELERVRFEVEEHSWKTAAGREDGSLGYQFGDITRTLG